MADNRNQRNPFEVHNKEGSLNTDPKCVLHKWTHDFGKMYNMQASCGNDQDSNLQGLGNIHVHENESHSDVSVFCGPITLREVCQSVLHLKANKASGMDEVPGEVLKNAKVWAFLHKFFNVCFESGKRSRGIIDPIPKASTSDPRDPLSYRGLLYHLSHIKCIVQFLMKD